jgi:type II secretory pathway component PulK
MARPQAHVAGASTPPRPCPPPARAKRRISRLFLGRPCSDHAAAARRRPAGQARGSLLIVTLWLVAILAVLAVAVGRYLSVEVRLMKNILAREQAAAMARSGVYLAMRLLSHDAGTGEALGGSYDWLGDEWAYFPLDLPDAEADATQWLVALPVEAQEGKLFGGEVRVRIVDEARKLDLNHADHEELADQLTRLLELEHEAVGSSADLADIVRAIVDAVDASDPAIEDQPAADPPYFAKNAPFVALEELGDLPGMTPEVYAILAEHTSPYRTSTELLNINTVTPEVLLAMGVSEGAIQTVLDYREGSDGLDAHERDGVFTQAGQEILNTLERNQQVNLRGTPDGDLLSSSAFDVFSQTFTVTSEGVVAEPTSRVQVQAVIRRTGCPDKVPAPCILAWREG